MEDQYTGLEIVAKKAKHQLSKTRKVIPTTHNVKKELNINNSSERDSNVTGDRMPKNATLKKNKKVKGKHQNQGKITDDGVESIDSCTTQKEKQRKMDHEPFLELIATDVTRKKVKKNKKKHLNQDEITNNQVEIANVCVPQEDKLVKVNGKDEVASKTDTKQKNIHKDEPLKDINKLKEKSTSIDNILAKIEKKRAKKLAQKLKKKLRKQESHEENKDVVKKSKHLMSNEEENIINHDNSYVAKTVTKLVEVEKSKSQKSEIDKKTKIEGKPKKYSSPEATIFVGNLPINTKRVQLLRLFKDYLPIQSIRLRTAGGKTIFKQSIRKSAGTLNAYLLLKDEHTAKRALTLNGCEFKGNHLRVQPAVKTDNYYDSKRTVFVGNLKYSATEEKLREIFAACGEIDYVRCLRNGEKGCNGVAYVCFKSPESVGLAIELNKTLLDERPIHVERYSVKKLGAKKTRDEVANAEKKSHKGIKKLSDKKEKKSDKRTPSKKHEILVKAKKKKSEFRGVKVSSLKKKSKKKPSKNQLQELAKKLAPKSLLQTSK